MKHSRAIIRAGYEKTLQARPSHRFMECRNENAKFPCPLGTLSPADGRPGGCQRADYVFVQCWFIPSCPAAFFDLDPGERAAGGCQGRRGVALADADIHPPQCTAPA